MMPTLLSSLPYIIVPAALLFVMWWRDQQDAKLDAADRAEELQPDPEPDPDPPGARMPIPRQRDTLPRTPTF